MRRDKSQASLSVFTPPYLLQRNTNHIVWLGSFLLLVDFCFTLTYSVLPSADSASCLDESAYRTFSPLYSFSRQYTDFTCLTMRYVGFITR